MVTRSVVQSAMHTAAMALSHLPPEEWAGWVAYLCQLLEQSAPEQDYDVEGVMRKIMAAIQERLDQGGW
ncbi:MAG: hypothetical protein JXA21_10090 [Anaerolineae bacterium]|nr:hypothetical protein [Anaerolineae bacterium]